MSSKSRYEPLKGRVGKLNICIDCGALVLTDLRVHHDAWHTWIAHVGDIADAPAYNNPAVREQIRAQNLEWMRRHPIV